MSGVYIKGMQMPESCYFDCPLFEQMPSDEDHESFNYCVLENWRAACTPTPLTVEEAKKGRQPWCPLIPIPDHGRLVDADAFREEMDKRYPFDKFTQSKHGEADAAKGTIIMMLANAPIIIPAEKEADNG